MTMTDFHAHVAGAVQDDPTPSLVFAAGGPLSRLKAGYQPRMSQIRMSEHLYNTFMADECAIVQGPTGTGKSLAYLVAGALAGAQTRRRVLVVTAGITLQEQLMDVELPLVSRIMQELGYEPLDFRILKGQYNYACPSRATKLKELLGKGRGADEHPDCDLTVLEDLARWAMTSSSCDRRDLPMMPSSAEWDAVALGAGNCRGKKCTLSRDCAYLDSRRRAFRADVTVTNYHALLTSVRMGIEKGLPSILQQFPILICDEAHEMGDIAREQLGFRIGRRAVFMECRHAPADCEERKSLLLQAEAFFVALAGLAGEGGEDDRTRQVRVREPVEIGQESLFVAIDAMVTFYESMVEDIEAGEQSTQADEKIDDVLRAASRLESIRDNLREGCEVSGENSVYWIERGRGGCVFKSALIDPSRVLHDHVFLAAQTAAITSATLETGGRGRERLAYVRGETGIPDTASELVLPSPFDWSRQSMGYVPMEALRDLPWQKDQYEQRQAAVGEIVADIIERAGGRTLALFTSSSGVRAAHEVCRARLPHHTILVQGERPRDKLLRDFRDHVSSSLLATRSFFTGVDVPGQSLSCLVIDRIPFPAPGDPIIEALCELHDSGVRRESFSRVMVPRAAMLVSQGVGRLIRDVADVGVVSILDDRLWEKAYGSVILSALPPGLQWRDDVAAFDILSETQHNDLPFDPDDDIPF